MSPGLWFAAGAMWGALVTLTVLAAWAQHRLDRELRGRRRAEHRRIQAEPGPGATHTAATPNRLHPSLRCPQIGAQGRSYAMQDTGGYSTLSSIADDLPNAAVCESALMVVSGIHNNGNQAYWIITAGNPSRDDICRMAQHAVTNSR